MFTEFDCRQQREFLDGLQAEIDWQEKCGQNARRARALHKQEAATLEMMERHPMPDCPAQTALEAPETAPAHGNKAFQPEGTTEAAPFVPEAFYPDTADKVDWVLGKIADHRARAARIRENAELMAKEADREAESLLWQFGPALQDFCRKELTGKKKSIRFFHGVIGYRTRPAALQVTNEPEARAWAEANFPAALRVDSRALAARLMDTGEVIDGAQLVPAEEVFYVK